ncbi:MFS transporter [Streptomyces ipomoeae]|uniref:alpha-amylase n=2 Tax=Streptomyces ipomoeae TaxID=103232 RepID=A0AAE8W4D8_9ACTN|nr:MFS transporter [Streptomyces ipomoeae]MDX2696580.1 DHA2 family efflux MFS transporter permease subunit [Streptomyces ipomoeae]MDX2841313.1 DHA2 family efflux MFS transporter permease subunit [Streptomyces ipomoeae]TQE20851.1 MFS transporter [Streptomyces ipomoeae]TQE33439.1 MFS transporter [Streptomyces ipomoeae]
MGAITLVKEEPTTTPAPSPATDPPRLGPRRVRLVFSALVLALLLAALEQMVVAVALPRIAGELQGLDRMSWAVTAYLLTATVALPVYGRLGELCGRKGVFQFALVVFVAGSALAGFSRTMDQLIAFRALQGVGAGGLMIGVQAIIADIVPPRVRGRFLGLVGAAFGLASITGPLLGGYLTDHLSWRWCFHLNVPFGLVTLAVVAFALKLPKPTAKGRLDVLGTLLLTVASTCLVLLAGWGGTAYAWDSRVVLGLAAGAVVATVLFLVVERFATQPLAPLRLFKDPVFVVTGLVGLAIGVALFGAATYLPTYPQMVDGATATQAGLLMLPLTGGIVGASVISGQLVSRTGHYKTYPILGSALCVVGLWLLAHLDTDTPRLHFGLWTALLGAGIGMVMPVLILAVQHSVHTDDIGSATNAGNCLRQLGGGVGVALLGALLTRRLAERLPAPADGVLPGIDSLTPGLVHALPAPVRDLYAEAYADAMPRLFLYLVPVLVLGLVIAFFLKEQPLVSHDEVPAEPPPPVQIPQARSPYTSGTTVSPGVPVCGTVQHPDGTVVPRAALTLIDATGRQTGRGGSREDGRYALSTPGPGAYVLIAAAGGHQPQAVTVTVGECPVEVDIVLGGAGRLVGTVRTPDGRAVPDATVTLTDVHGEVVVTTRSGEEGGYLITELVAGEYTLAAGAHSYRPAALPVTVQAGRETRQDVELAGGAVLRGTVRAGGGRPVEDARVTLLDAAGNVVDTLTTGIDGTFRFVDIATGEYTVIAMGYPPVATVLQMAGGGRTERDLQLGYAD